MYFIFYKQESDIMNDVSPVMDKSCESQYIEII